MPTIPNPLTHPKSGSFFVRVSEILKQVQDDTTLVPVIPHVISHAITHVIPHVIPHVISHVIPHAIPHVIPHVMLNLFQHLKTSIYINDPIPLTYPKSGSFFICVSEILKQVQEDDYDEILIQVQDIGFIKHFWYE